MSVIACFSIRGDVLADAKTVAWHYAEYFLVNDSHDFLMIPVLLLQVLLQHQSCTHITFLDTHVYYRVRHWSRNALSGYPAQQVHQDPYGTTYRHPPCCWWPCRR
jgi:hypothetical protein